jgi:hypothetical protein
MKNTERRVFDPEVDVQDKREGPGCAQLEGPWAPRRRRHGRPPAVDDPLLIDMASRTITRKIRLRVGSTHKCLHRGGTNLGRSSLAFINDSRLTPESQSRR